MKREIRDARKTTTAVEAIAGLDHETEIFGFTKGQFSLLNLLEAVLMVTGPAHLSLSTWTAASYEVEGLAAMQAVARPLASDDLYFVADGSGGHVFAKTLEDHNRNVAHWRALAAKP